MYVCLNSSKCVIFSQTLFMNKEITWKYVCIHMPEKWVSCLLSRTPRQFEISPGFLLIVSQKHSKLEKRLTVICLWPQKPSLRSIWVALFLGSLNLGLCCGLTIRYMHTQAIETCSYWKCQLVNLNRAEMPSMNTLWWILWVMHKAKTSILVSVILATC